MRSYDGENYIRTLSKKHIRKVLSDPILGTDGTGKKLGSLENIVNYKFRLRRQNPRATVNDYYLSEGYKIMGKAQVRGSSATVWYYHSNSVKVCRLSKEGDEWKVDEHYEYPTEAERKASFEKKE